MENLKDDIRKRFVTRSRIETEFERVVAAIEKESNHLKSLDERIEVLLTEVRLRMEKESMPALEAEGVDRSLIKEAFDMRFEEVRLTRMHRYFPGLLPEEDRPEFHDPDWDQREDPVPSWVTIVHVMFVASTVIIWLCFALL